MDQRLHFITLATRDLDAARAFYRDGLGWEANLDVPGEILFYQVAPGLLLGLFDADKFAEDLGVTTAAPAPRGVTLSRNVDSPDAVRSTVDAMTAAGGSVLKIVGGHVRMAERRDLPRQCQGSERCHLGNRAQPRLAHQRRRHSGTRLAAAPIVAK